LEENEFDLPEIYEKPLEVVVQTLEKFKSYDEMINNFPDTKLAETDNKNEETNHLPSGKIIAHDSRYIQEATLYGSLNMPIYESKLVNSNFSEAS